MIPRLIYLIEKEIHILRESVLTGVMNEMQYKVAIGKIDALLLAIEIAKKVETSSDEEEFETDFTD